MGKTRLASQVALGVASTYEAGAWLVELASISTGDRVPAQIAAAVASNATSMTDIGSDLRARGSMLLVLDNCEHVIEAAAEAANELIASVPGLSLLATSRQPIQLDAEVVWSIPPLVEDDARCELFEDRFERATGRRLAGADRSAVSELCGLLDGSPLAIELAAVQAREVPMSVLVDVVREGEDPLQRRGTRSASELGLGHRVESAIASRRAAARLFWCFRKPLAGSARRRPHS